MRRERLVGVVIAIGLVCLAVLLVVSYAKQPCLFTQKRNTRPICVFRYDDYSGSSHTEIEKNLLQTFERHGIPVMFSVIPFVAAGDVRDPASTGEVPLTPEKAEMLKRAMERGVVTVAQHGYSHRTVEHVKYSELVGVPLQEQREKIAKGRQLLEEMLGVSVDIFVPPWNTYDASTVAVLEELGFSCLSAGVQWPPRLSPLQMLPVTQGLEDVQTVVEHARGGGDSRPVIVVLFHSYDFFESGDRRGHVSLEQLDELLGWVRAQDDLDLPSARTLLKDTLLSKERLRIARLQDLLAKMVPPLFQDFTPRWIPDRSAIRVLMWPALGAGAFYGVLLTNPALLGFWGALLLCGRGSWGLRSVRVLARYLCPVLVLVCVLAGLARGLHLVRAPAIWQITVTTCALVGCWLGLVGALRHSVRRETTSQ